MGHSEMLSILEEFEVSAQAKGMWMVKKQAPQGAANVCKLSDFKCTSSEFKVR